MTQRFTFARRPAVLRLILTAFVLSAVLSTPVLVLAADGDLDASFGSGGIVITNHSEFDQIQDIVIQPDGKIVAAGTSGTLPVVPFFESPALDILVARYNSDGSLDSAFGSGGIVTTNLGFNDGATSVALQADGKIVIAGGATPNNESFFVVARYNTNGSLDTTFGSGGIVTTFVGQFAIAQDLAIQRDGKIVVTGNSALGIAVVRYNTNGSLDTTFGDDGIVRELRSNFFLTNVAWAMALQADGKIVVAGEHIDNSQNIGTDSFLLLRYNPDGSRDTAFGVDGLVITGFGSARDIVIQPDGKMVAAGSSFQDFGNVVVLMRYKSDGSLDTSFDGDGIVVSATNSANRYIANAAVLQSDGKILVAGDSLDTASTLVMTISRYNSDGSFDTTFGGDGIVTTSIGGHLTGTAIALQADGKIMAGGYANFDVDPNTAHVIADLALVRYDNTAPISADFVTGGGWISSPEGMASFGVVAKYHKDASVPTGSTTFQFPAGGLNFKSTSYDSLILSGNKVQLKGAGQINGSGSYRFVLTCIDGDQPGGDGLDKFRMRIWSDSQGVIYDNQLNAPDNVDPTTVLGGGNIVIHR